MKTNEKDTKRGVVPPLRFPEFSEAGEWAIITLNKLASRIIKKNNEHICRVLTNSATDGVVDQTDYFDRNIVSEKNLHNYYVIENGDYVYNPRISTSAPVGPISKNYIGQGVMSPLYTIFRFHNDHNEFYNQYFKTKHWHKYLKNITNQGARFDRINITTDDFMNMPIPAPCQKEQQKIAACLSSIDALIKATEKKIDELKAHKKGLMQQLFPAEGKTVPQYRFPKFRNTAIWKEIPLSGIGETLQGYGFPEAYQGKEIGKYPFYKVSDISKAIQRGNNYISVAANYVDDEDVNTLKIKTIPIGTTIFARIGEAIRLNRRVITTAECIIDNNTIGVKAIEGKATDLFVYYTLLQINLIDFAGGVVPAVTKASIDNIPVYCPPTIAEQQKIADCLSSVDDLITAQTNRLEALKAHKKGLMQQLFPNTDEC